MAKPPSLPESLRYLVQFIDSLLKMPRSRLDEDVDSSQLEQAIRESLSWKPLEDEILLLELRRIWHQMYAGRVEPGADSANAACNGPARSPERSGRRNAIAENEGEFVGILRQRSLESKAFQVLGFVD